MRPLRWGFAILVLPAGAGCVTIDPPDGYVKLSDPKPYDLKAVSPHGDVIALTARPNEGQNADLNFWTEALEYQKVDIDGMKLVDRQPIRARNGLKGVLFNFAIGEGQAEHTYLVALYVTPHRIFTIEAAGPTPAIAQDMPKLRRSMESLH